MCYANNTDVLDSFVLHLLNWSRSVRIYLKHICGVYGTLQQPLLHNVAGLAETQ